MWLKVQKPLPIPSLKIVVIKYTDTVPFSPDGTYNGDNHAFVMKIGNDTPVEIGSEGNGNDMLEL